MQSALTQTPPVQMRPAPQTFECVQLVGAWQDCRPPETTQVWPLTQSAFVRQVAQTPLTQNVPNRQSESAVHEAG